MIRVHPAEAWLGLGDWIVEHSMIVKEAMEQGITQASALNELARVCHEANMKWWLDLSKPCLTCLDYTKPHPQCVGCGGFGYMMLKDRNVGELITLCHSELS